MTQTLTSIAEVMSADVPTITPEASLRAAAELMLERRVGALIVLGEEGRIGIISDRDLTRAAAAGSSGEAKVASHNTADIIQAEPDWSVQRAAETMARGGFRHLVVVEAGRPVGMVAIRDLLQAVLWGPEGRDPSEVEAVATDTGERDDLLYSYRRTAKQHLVAADCTCEMEWLEVLTGQLDARPDLGAEELRNLWASRAPCPRLMEPGGAD